MATRRMRHSPSGSPVHLPPAPPPFVPTPLEGSALVWAPVENPISEVATDWTALPLVPENQGEGYFIQQVGQLWELDGELRYVGANVRWFWVHALASVSPNAAFPVTGDAVTPICHLWVGRGDEIPPLANPDPLAHSMNAVPNGFDAQEEALVVTEDSRTQIAAVNLVELSEGDGIAVAYGSLLEFPGLVINRLTLTVLPAGGWVRMPDGN